MTATTDLEAIKAVLSTYQRALNESDAALAASLYAPDGVFMPLFAPTATAAEILPSYELIFKAIQLDITFTIDDITIDGDTAHVLTRSEGNVSIHENGLTAPEANRELFVFQRHDDQWKIARYMFNKTAAAGA